jgi:hypothetical protein
VQEEKSKMCAEISKLMLPGNLEWLLQSNSGDIATWPEFWHVATYCHVYESLKTGFGLVKRFIDHLRVVATNNYNAVTTSTLYSSLEHTV